MTTKLLLFPWGNNNGHVVRCGALGNAAMRQGMSVAIPVLTQSQGQIVRAMGCAPVMYPSGSVPREFWSVWGDVDFVRHAVALDIDMINEHRPDLVVHDGRMSANVACSVSSVPSVGVMQHIHFPGPWGSKTPIRDCPYSRVGSFSGRGGLKPTSRLAAS
jgi:UDP:flavonoid glycosyltransferase YjiC (YdhE family)